MTHFPHIQALAEFARHLDDGDSQTGVHLVWADHLDLLEGYDHEAGALQEIVAILTEVIRSATNESASAADRMVRSLGATASDVVRYGVNSDTDTDPLRALFRSFVGVDAPAPAPAPAPAKLDPVQPGNYVMVWSDPVKLIGPVAIGDVGNLGRAYEASHEAGVLWQAVQLDASQAAKIALPVESPVAYL